MSKANGYPALQEAYKAEINRQAESISAIMGLAPVFVSYIGSDCRYKVVSRHYLEYFGRTLEQIVGKEMREVIGEEAWQQVAPAIHRALQGEVAKFQAQFHVPGRGARWSEGVYTPDIDTTGQVQGVVICVSDITELRRHERSLGDDASFYRSIFDFREPLISKPILKPKCFFAS